MICYINSRRSAKLGERVPAAAMVGARRLHIRRCWAPVCCIQMLPREAERGTLECQRAVNADAAAEILVMTHHNERAGIGFERLHQPIHRGNIEVIRRLIQHE